VHQRHGEPHAARGRGAQRLVRVRPRVRREEARCEAARQLVVVAVDERQRRRGAVEVARDLVEQDDERQRCAGAGALVGAALFRARASVR